MFRTLLLGLLMVGHLFAHDYETSDAWGYRYGYPDYSNPFTFGDARPEYYGYGFRSNHRYNTCCAPKRKKVVYRQQVGRDRCCKPIYSYRVNYKHENPCCGRRKRGFFRRIFNW